MKIGVQLPEVERPVSWPEVRDMALAIEEVGFDSIWVGDHLLYRDADGSRGPWEAWSQLAALGEITERVMIGPLVAATSFHSPAMIAKKAATVDAISGGRLILGLGAGWNVTEYEAFGFAYDNRVSRFEEAFTIIRTLIREGSIDFEGDYYQIRGMELLPGARLDMELMVGSNGPRMLDITIPHVDMWNTWHVWFGNTPAGLGPLMKQVDEAATKAGRAPAEVGRTAAVFIEMKGAIGRLAGSDRPESTPLTGTVEEIAAEFGAYREAGIDHLQLVLDPINRASIEKAGGALEVFRSTG
ncbi:MAG: LLM class flavin-dependent oxidoreductase [Acidimicrobiia bacterium]|nr:LLM class flavin-dependent oxidoreductase [Acidimicrobiia bacterium]MDH3462623.1 LLM class flavin-dependent oxidoreductase [Acidimicrobiia bacterium]